MRVVNSICSSRLAASSSPSRPGNIFREGKRIDIGKRPMANPGSRHHQREGQPLRIPNDRLIVLEFETDCEHLEDSSDQYECMQIYFDGNPAPWII